MAKKDVKNVNDKKKFTHDTFNSICNRLASSSDGLVKICKEHNVSAVSFYSWIQEDVDLLNKYTRAREDQADYMADEMIQIADDRSRDNTPFTGANHVQRDRLKIETRKWLAMKLKPKKYGDKLDIDVQNKIITVEVKDE